MLQNTVIGIQKTGYFPGKIFNGTCTCSCREQWFGISRQTEITTEVKYGVIFGIIISGFYSSQSHYKTQVESVQFGKTLGYKPNIHQKKFPIYKPAVIQGRILKDSSVYEDLSCPHVYHMKREFFMERACPDRTQN